MDKSRLKSYFLDKNSKISDAINILQKNIIKLVVIVEKGKLVGIITDGDIRRGLIRKFSIDDKCKDIMNKKPIFIYSDEKNDLKNFNLKKDYHPERRYIIVVNKLEKVTDIIDRAESQQSLDNTILIMAGGEGRRMLPHTASLPKPMLRIKNKPIIRIIIDRLISHGFTNISISVKYKYDKLVDYFKDSSLVLPSSISQIELTQLLENSCRFRNETKGHGGYIENESAKFLNDELIVMLEKFRSLLTNVWDDISLVKGYKIHLSGKVYTNHFSLLKGSNSEFLKESRDMTMALDQESLYLAYLNQTKALRLEPLLQISASPRSAKNACYFYSSMNKNTAKFVSYHHSEENYIEGNQFKETISTINSLNGD